MGLVGGGTEIERTTAPGDLCAATPETRCERPDTGMGGHPNLAQGPLPVGSRCRTEARGTIPRGCGRKRPRQQA